jgi:hypothetical protein
MVGGALTKPLEIEFVLQQVVESIAILGTIAVVDLITILERLDY